MDFTATIWSLLPPVVAIALALITKEVYSSLFIGVLVGGLLATGFAPVATLNTILEDGLIASLADNAGIFLFLVLLGIMVALINKSGGAAAFGRWAQSHIHGKVGAAICTFFFGVLIFVDDYFNCLTVGTVMRPVTDTHKISRVKLAYLIDATAAPICMIAPISSWAAAVSGVASELNTGVSSIHLFIQAIPYNFYSLLTIVFIIAISLMKFDFGSMARFEVKAEETGDLSKIAGAVEEEDSGKGKVIDLIFPIVILIIACVGGLIYNGVQAGGVGLIGAFEETDSYVGLPWGTIIALIVTIIFLVARRVLTFKEAMDCIPKGFIAMVPAICILMLALSLKTMTNDMLCAADYVRDVMLGAAGGLFNLLPAIIFVVACFLAFSTGTSWGTFGILIPIVMAIFTPGTELMTIGISACLAGAVCGDHCSPISDTTIMASAGAQCNHVEHVSTQIPYAVTVAATSFVFYIVAGFVQNWLIVLPLACAGMVAVLAVIKKATGKAA